jgi:hypothetical protein
MLHKVMLAAIATGAIALMASGFMALPSAAAPLGNAPGNLNAVFGDNSDLQNVHWRRRCWWHHGHWHCRRPHAYYYRPYPYYYGSPYFYGPSFGIFVGPRHRHHRRHWRW